MPLPYPPQGSPEANLHQGILYGPKNTVILHWVHLSASHLAISECQF